MASSVNKAPGISVERAGTRRYIARNERGGELVVGYDEGEFSPGDLLKIALLGCNVLSADARFARALGDDYEMTGTISATYLKEEDRFTEFLVELFPNLEGFYPEDREQLLDRAKRAIDRYCTISHTVTESAPTNLIVDGDKL